MKMGKLADAMAQGQKSQAQRISGKIDGNDLNINISLDNGGEDVEVEKQRYNRKWLDSIAIHMRYAITPDELKAQKILAALDRRNGQCPCGGNGSQFKCPCHIMRNNGICKCGLFVEVADRRIHGATTSGRIE